jgi:hypothetical protein
VPLSDEQKREVVLIATVGCDQETAAKYVNCSVEQIGEEMVRDPRFGADVRRAEAGCELGHMRCVQQATRQEGPWRASVWWLERRFPERYGRRDAGTIGRRDLVRFLGAVAGGLASAIRSEEDRQRVLDALSEFAESLVEPLSFVGGWDESAEGDGTNDAREDV